MLSSIAIRNQVIKGVIMQTSHDNRMTAFMTGMPATQQRFASGYLSTTIMR